MGSLPVCRFVSPFGWHFGRLSIYLLLFLQECVWFLILLFIFCCIFAFPNHLFSILHFFFLFLTFAFSASFVFAEVWALKKQNKSEKFPHSLDGLLAIFFRSLFPFFFSTQTEAVSSLLRRQTPIDVALCRSVSCFDAAMHGATVTETNIPISFLWWYNN